jgi:hypothetical protein
MKEARLVGLLVPALALAMPALAQVRPTTLTDSQEPGSVIVFPKFVQGSVSLPEGGTAPITELEIGVVCPKGVVCPEHEPVKIRFHWVCGTSEAAAATSFVCQETDFDITATVWEKIILTPNGEGVNFYTSGLPTKFSPGANCPNGGGYLIGWMITPSSDTPIKFDALVGDAHLRVGSPASGPINPFAGSPLSLASYDAIPIQADPNLASGAAINTNAAGALLFDGAPGDYQAVTGQIFGDVRYTNLTTGPTFSLGALTLLTLDVRSNRPNNPTFVDLDFFGGNPSSIGNENVLSTATEFICWEEVPLTSINGDLVTSVMGREGVFASDQATKIPFVPSDGVTGPVPLLGLAEVLEGGVFPPTGPWPRAAFTGLFNSSVPVIPPLSTSVPHFQPNSP